MLKISLEWVNLLTYVINFNIQWRYQPRVSSSMMHVMSYYFSVDPFLIKAVGKGVAKPILNKVVC